MDANTITSLITSVGFPIVMCGAMAWYVKHMSDKFSQEREKQSERHKEEMDSISSALNNNTIALTRLCEKLDKE